MISKLVEDLSQKLARGFPRSRKKLAVELVPVVVGLKTASLIDSLLLSRKDANLLADCLAGIDPTLLVVFEEVSGQTLVVNRNLLDELLAQEIIFVEVGGNSPRQLPSRPDSFVDLLAQITSTSLSISFLALTLTDPERPQALITLVGYLLDYSVAYSFVQERADGKNCLGGIELVLVEASLVDDSGLGERARLLSFSYPASLVSDTPSLQPLTTTFNLRGKLEGRLSRASRFSSGPSNCRIEVESKIVVLDQVAL
ncbi:hypothetical protein JCM5350_002434 [Sporobolomyces pararoseus]